MDIKTSEILEANVLLYHQNKMKIDELEKAQDELKEQNLHLVKMLGLKKGDYAVFDKIGLQIQLLEMVKKEGVDEEGLVGRYGDEKTEYLKVIPVKAVEMAIKLGKLPKGAEDFIHKKDPVEYTKITATASGVHSNDEIK
jgi:hypothetical protein